MSSLIKFEKVRKTYIMGENRLDALKDIDLEINHHELTSIIGPSGSGKSTIMNIVGLLDRPTAGRYILDGQEVESMTDDDMAAFRNLKIGFVFQSFFLLPKLNALQNVSLPLLYRKTSGSETKNRAMEELAKVGMDKHWRHKPSQLSGGQQQRVAIARALIAKPSVILADEPTGALDSNTSRSVMELFKSLNKDNDVTVVIITHDPKVSAQCDRAIRVEDGVIVSDTRNN